MLFPLQISMMVDVILFFLVLNPGRLRPANPYFGGVQGPRGAFVQSSTYHQPVSYGYQQGFAYPPYG